MRNHWIDESVKKRFEGILTEDLRYYLDNECHSTEVKDIERELKRRLWESLRDLFRD
jgi:hypothetical protein